LIGLLMIFVTRRAQRLGDLMARTLVIHETKIDWSLFEQIEARAAASSGMAILSMPPIRLTPSQWELLHRYLNRREHFEQEARGRLALAIRQSLKTMVRGTDLEISSLPSEAWLMELARRT
jgi:hypothetical protein